MVLLLKMASPSEMLIFYVNGKKVSVSNPNPSETLLTFLRRSLGLTGSKLGCGEGGCGACTVMLSKFDRSAAVIRHYSVTACLTPLCSVHGLAVTTVEGIGSVSASDSKLHAVQERIAKAHGSQCGFCTPGIVMSMYTLLRNNPHPSEEEIEAAFQGNLCRCTGYRPILDGFKTFAGKESCCGKCNENCNQDMLDKNGAKEEPTLTKLFDPEDFKPYDPSQELTFPCELQTNSAYDETSLHFTSSDQTWFRPTTLPELLSLKKKYPDAKLVIGNSELGVDARVKKVHYRTFIHVADLPELNEVSLKPDCVIIGASVSLSKIESFFNNILKELPEYQCRSFVAILEMLKWFAGSQIRNVASLGGNIVTASPISDLNPLLIACGAVIHLIDTNDSSPSKRVLDQFFFKGYRQTDLSRDQLLLSVEIPFTTENTHVYGYKQSHRREDDIAIVNAGMLVRFDAGSSHVQDLCMAFGGMAPVTKVAEKTRKLAIGKSWNDELCQEIICSLSDEFPLAMGSPGGSEVYRRCLVVSLFFRFFRVVESVIQENNIDCREKSSYNLIPRELSRGSQLFNGVPSDQNQIDPIGRPLVHLSALKHATGQATYVDDMPTYTSELHFAPVLSRRAHARILQVDNSAALEMEGVKGWVDAQDVPGSNNVGHTRDHRVFAESETVHYGELIGGILGETKSQALKAAQFVNVEYENLDPILTAEQAIKEKAYFSDFVLSDGDVSAGFSESDEKVQGELHIGGQEHFYLETMSNLAIPKEDGGMEVHSSTQFPKDTQESVALALGVPLNSVNIRVQRIGGGFGGKETNVVPVCTPVAVAARKFGVPVRWMLDRDDDMTMTGKRHPCLAKYKLGVSKDGVFKALDMELYLNGGHSQDLSPVVTMVSCLQGHLGYRFPNIRVHAFACKTNISSNTAFRGFGHPQCRLTVETSICHAASVLGKPPEEIREKNFSKVGDVLPFGLELKSCKVQDCWSNCTQLSHFEERRDVVDDYNRSNRWKKRGIAMMPLMYGCSYETKHLNQAAALIHIYLDGSVLLTHGGVEMGQGLHTKMIQVASRCLGIDTKWIRTIETATDKTPNTSSTAASFSTDLNGNAIMNACSKLMKRLEPVRKDLPNATWPELVEKAYRKGISLSASGFHYDGSVTFDAKAMKGNPFLYFTHGAACTEVEIDCLTGDHVVKRVDIVMDIGKSLNPSIDIGQIEGAFMQGYGMVTLEELRMSPKGQYYTTGPSTYKIPGFNDIPEELNVHLLRDSECEYPRSVYSSKAVGEPPLLLSLSVFLALRDAIGAARSEHGVSKFCPLDSPATCERIRLACEDSLLKKVKSSKLPEDSGQRWDIRL